MEEISAGLAAIGLDASRIHTEPFGPASGLTPGIAATPARTPHPPAGQAGTGPTIEFARSNLAVPLERRLRQPARARRGLRRPGPLVVPHRRLPHLRDHAHRRRPRLQPRPGRAARRRKRAHLLLTATRRRSARSVTGSLLVDEAGKSGDGLQGVPLGPRRGSNRRVDTSVFTFIARQQEQDKLVRGPLILVSMKEAGLSTGFVCNLRGGRLVSG